MGFQERPISGLQVRDMLKITGCSASLRPYGDKPPQLIFNFERQWFLELGFTAGDRFLIHMGFGDHQGLLRLERHETGMAPVRRKKLPQADYFTLNVGVMKELQKKSEKSRPVIMRLVAADVIEIELPPWFWFSHKNDVATAIANIQLKHAGKRP